MDPQIVSPRIYKMIPLLLLCFFGSIVSLLLYQKIQTSPQNRPQSQQISVVTSFYPLAEFSRQIGQQKANVYNLTPVGVEPHDYEPSPQDLASIQQAALFIYNGAGLEQWIEKIDQIGNVSHKSVNASSGIATLTANNQDQAPFQQQKKDPHVWLDPILAVQQVETIKNGYVLADPKNAAYYQQNAFAYQKQLIELDGDFQRGLANCESREIVTSHNAFQYLAQRYNLRISAISGMSPDDEPSPKKMAEVADFVKQHHVQYIFFEQLVSPKLAETIAQETGAKTIAFNPLEGLTTTEIQDGQNYLSIQRANLAALRIALRCK